MNQKLDSSIEKAAIAETLLSSASRLLRSRKELEVIQGVCESLCGASSHVQLAWTWFGPTSAKVIRPQAYAGSARDYAANLVIDRNFITELGPAFRTIEGESLDAFKVSPWSIFGPWRTVAKEHGVRSVLAVPLHSSFSDQSGIFVIYADEEDYFAEVGTGLFKAIGALFSSVLSSSAEFAELKQTANCDALTGVLNRHALPIVERRVARSSLFDPKAYVFVIDLDHFKLVNDNHGHSTGDTVLQRTAQAMRNLLRRDDDLMRWGGEEFVVFLANTSLEDALTVAEKLRNAIELLREPVPVTISIGVAEVIPQRAIQDSIEIADQALFEAKRAGRNRVFFKA